MSFPLPKNQRIIKQYPDIGAGIATGYPREQVVGDQVVGAGEDVTGKKPYPVNLTPMQGPGDNPSAQPVMPKLQPFTPSPEQAEEGIDQQRLLTDSEYQYTITGQKLKSPAAERVMNALRLADKALKGFEDEGGTGSGHHGHSGRLGQRGGSSPSDMFPTGKTPEKFLPPKIYVLPKGVKPHSDESVLGYYNPNTDRVVIANNEVDNGSTVVHEIGHYTYFHELSGAQQKLWNNTVSPSDPGLGEEAWADEFGQKYWPGYKPVYINPPAAVKYGFDKLFNNLIRSIGG